MTKDEIIEYTNKLKTRFENALAEWDALSAFEIIKDIEGHNKDIYQFLLDKLTNYKKGGLIAWLARLLNHPYGWESSLTKEESEALNKLGIELGIIEK